MSDPHEKDIPSPPGFEEGHARVREELGERLRSEASEAEIADIVRAAVRSTLRAPAGVALGTARVVRAIAAAAFRAVEDVGGGFLRMVRAVGKGVILGVTDVGGDAATAAREVSGAAVEAAARVGADVGAVARRVVDGVAEGAQEAGARTAEIARTAASGALDAASVVGETALRAVHGLLVGVASGIEAAAGAVRPRRETAEAPPADRRAADRKESARAKGAGGLPDRSEDEAAAKQKPVVRRRTPSGRKKPRTKQGD